MKKTLLTLLGCLFACSAMTFAQPKHHPKQYLPEEGDMAIGIDITPVFKYLGNAFNNSTDNTLETLGGKPFTNRYDKFSRDNLMPDVSIMGKYMITDEWALKANVGLKISTLNDKRYVIDEQEQYKNPLSEKKAIDKAHYVNNGVSILFGGEYRKGEKRVQGVFGAGVLFAYQNSRVKYTYNNEMTTINQTPQTGFDDVYNGASRTLSENQKGADIYTGLTGSAGLEWFVAPKIALGAEVNLTLYYLFGTESYRTSEYYNAKTNKVEKWTDLVSPGNSGIHFGTESLGGSLYMIFYF